MCKAKLLQSQAFLLHRLKVLTDKSRLVETALLSQKDLISLSFRLPATLSSAKSLYDFTYHIN